MLMTWVATWESLAGLLAGLFTWFLLRPFLFVCWVTRLWVVRSRWNVAPVSKGLRCMSVIGSVVGHHPRLKMISLTWHAWLPWHPFQTNCLLLPVLAPHYLQRSVCSHSTVHCILPGTVRHRWHCFVCVLVFCLWGRPVSVWACGEL